MKNLIFLPIIFIIGVVQVTLLDAFRLFNVKPDLLLIGVVITSLYFNFNLKWALLLAVFSGILKDVLSLNPFGLNTLLFTLGSFLMVKLSRKISLDNDFIRALLLFMLILFNDVIIRSTYFSLRQQFIPLGIFLRTLFLECLYSAAILPLISKYSFKNEQDKAG